MPYLYKRVITKHADFVTRTKCFYYNPDKAKGKRGVRLCSAGESKKLRNKRNAYLKRKYMIYNNFDVGDMWITLTWQKDMLGELNAEEAHRALMCVLGKIRKKLARKKIPFVYFAKTEAGENTRVHHHLFVKNNFDVISMIFDYWKAYGKVKDFQQIYDFGSGRLVKYFLDGGDHKGLDFEKYSHSRNLQEPEIEKHIYPFNSFRENPKPPKDKDGIHYEIRNLYNGFADIDGYIYQEYELVKLQRE